MNKISKLFQIKYPIIQAGMVWASGWRLASAVSNAGGLGLIGAGSMHPAVLRNHIKKFKKASNKPFGVNIPLFYPQLDEIISIIIEEKVPIVFTSAGSPRLWTSILKENDIKVVQVVSSVNFALKSQDAGVDAIVAEGFEAGGHNGREETTTMTLIPMVKAEIDLPIIAAGGIATGGAMLAAIALGADGVQVGSRFVASNEASSHPSFKQEVVRAVEGSTVLTLKEITPVRMLKNSFFQKINSLYQKGTDVEELKLVLGKGRAKRGMFEGDLEEGELEIGQISGLINDILPAAQIVKNLIDEYNQALRLLKRI
ncbi:MAG: nitronate monooxygenase [Flavobacteriaceae bacterium]|nr:nitronate monooxygenase [Flavobacteriaceae bacterium]